MEIAAAVRFADLPNGLFARRWLCVQSAQGATATAKPATAKPAAASTTALDNLLAPIALYPDALIAQILEASKDFAAVQKFAGWLKSNSALKGTALQDAAQKAGFATCYIALAPFPEVIKMMVEKPDWTKPLGAAFTSDEAAVYQSVQRLRAAAMALGNLKTTPQQEVVTETAANGQTVILVQPANPQVVYVPVYNTQVVYVQQAPPPSSNAVAAAAVIGFTAGIIIASSSNNYYYGPYAWRGGGHAYHEAYERREDYLDDWQDYVEDRRDNAQDNAEDRRDNAQDNQTQRQSPGNANQRHGNPPNQPVAAPIDRASQPVDATDRGPHRQRWQRRDGAGEPGEPAVYSAGKPVQPAVRPPRAASGYQSGASARSQSARGSSSRSARGGGRRTAGAS